jgi:hypothetical protein
MSGRKVVFLVFALPTFVFFGLIFLVDWSDYQFRGCPGAAQCSDAIGTMIIAAIIMAILSLLGGLGFWASKRSKE